MRVFVRSFLYASAALLMAMGFGTTLRADYVSDVEALDPLCYYQFNDGSGVMANGATCADTGSSALNGTYISGGSNQTVTLGPSGNANLGNAAYFTNGTSTNNLGLVQAPNSELPTGSAARTIVFWVQTTPNANSDGGWHVDYRYGTPFASNGQDVAGYVVGGTNHLGGGSWGYSQQASQSYVCRSRCSGH